MIVYNPSSGRGSHNAMISKIEERMISLGFTCNIKETEYPGHAKEIVKKAPSREEGMLIIMGGDGTFNECLNGIMEAGINPLIGYVPTGTSCDIARTLGIPKKLDKALDIIENHMDVRMDIVKTTHGYFTYVCAIGNYVDVSHTTPRRLKRLIGFFAYLLTGIKEFFTIRIMPMSIVVDGKPLKRRYYSLVLILNTKRVAGFRIVNWPILDDGKVDLILYRYIPFVNNFLYLFSFIFHVRKFPGIETYKASTIEFHTPTPNRWNIDGEKAGQGRQTVEVLPKALNVIINPDQKSLFINQGVSDNE
ncbi:MAG: diacylglycerol/lipid kinase family protein [Bacillota bacterium]